MTSKKNYAFFSLLTFGLAWQIAGSFQWIDVSLFPTPVAILTDLFQQMSTLQFWSHIFTSLRRLLFGFSIGWPLGVLLAVGSGHSEKWRAICSPFINFGYPLPKVALLPLVLVLFGIGELSKVVLVSIGVFFLMYIPVLNALLLLQSQPVMDVARIYRIRGQRYWLGIVGRGLVLDIITGSKSAFGYGLVLVVVAEAQMTREGIGYFVWQAWDQFRIIEIYDALFVLGGIGMLAGAFCDWMTRRLVNRYSLGA